MRLLGHRNEGRLPILEIEQSGIGIEHRPVHLRVRLQEHWMSRGGSLLQPGQSLDTGVGPLHEERWTCVFKWKSGSVISSLKKKNLLNKNSTGTIGHWWQHQESLPCSEFWENTAKPGPLHPSPGSTLLCAHV